ncbi:MAG: MotA/TolQ/ExbB proton channel family protein [Zoogloeaceae bacterium]|jgi:biopolymer transport protein ExbB|nr:MotA/TolQ/ExbB proton channel family protein [Zoogloeaceae bacterium]
MTFTHIHDFVFYLMGASLLLAFYVIIERSIFYFSTLRESRQVADFVQSHLHDKSLHAEIISFFDRHKSPPARALCEVVRALQEKRNQEQAEYTVQAIYVEKQPALHTHLWILDTVITLSPLMGLLGTILGIIDAFTSLSSGNVAADPSAVSRGIGTALYATGFGIFIALFAMLFFNYFTSRAERIASQIKLISLKLLASH